MARPKKKEQPTLAERWRDNHGSALVTIGIGVTIFGASLLHLVRTIRAKQSPNPITLGNDIAVSMHAPGHMRIYVSGFPTDEGVCLLNVYGKSRASVNEFSPVERAEVPIKDGEVYYEVNDITPGIYYLAALHDVNRDGKPSSANEPAEWYGYSNEAPGEWGQPELTVACFRLASEWRSVRFSVREP